MIHIEKRMKWRIIWISMGIILFLLCVVATTIGVADIKVIDALKIVTHQLPGMKNMIKMKDIPKSHEIIIKSIRLPRILLSVLVGISLAISGATFQGMFKNPMADPFVIGISSGAALGATLAIVLKIDIKILGINTISLFALFGALGTTYMVYNLARIKSKIPVTTLLLSGIAVGQFLTAIMSFLMVLYSNDLEKIIFWTLGSFSTKGWEQVKVIILPVFIGWSFLYYFSKDLNVMLLGEESAKNLGVEVEKTKRILLLINSIIVAIAVSVSGIIGFVGLIIPHIVRILVGPDHRILIPVAGLGGGLFMLFADTVARTIIAPIEIPVGIITAIFGGPFFIYLLRQKKSSLS
ncbi:FecCD family ABC transporter permease [Inediibacterium massiliense]|uniref:FecCD family ABC transporter permease n=1 Tax=Inediibacterium massiliense TaxID=1658111 RepID=UPI0006B64BB8|nr:iron chelate uptake ABC transporter family permease subunit [Inediibacterium massiliense]